MKLKGLVFPNNYRLIAERRFLISACSFVLVVEILFAGILVSQGYKQKQALDMQRLHVLHEIGKWERVVAKYPDYRDGYLRLSILTYALGDTMRAMQYVDKALEIDPNYVVAIELKKKIH